MGRAEPLGRAAGAGHGSVRSSRFSSREQARTTKKSGEKTRDRKLRER
jgi:hypothetical protein